MEVGAMTTEEFLDYMNSGKQALEAIARGLGKN